MKPAIHQEILLPPIAKMKLYHRHRASIISCYLYDDNNVYQGMHLISKGVCMIAPTMLSLMRLLACSGME